MGSIWDRSGLDLGSILQVDLGSNWLGSIWIWGGSGVELGSIWARFWLHAGSILGRCSARFGVDLGSELSRGSVWGTIYAPQDPNTPLGRSSPAPETRARGSEEFMILPVGATSFKDAVVIGAEVYHTLKACIKKKYGQDAVNVGDEGGFAPSVQDNNEARACARKRIAADSGISADSQRFRPSRLYSRWHSDSGQFWSEFGHFWADFHQLRATSTSSGRSRPFFGETLQISIESRPEGDGQQAGVRKRAVCLCRLS